MRIRLKTFCVISILITLLIIRTEGQTPADVENIMTKVFSSDVYNKHIRGQKDLSQTTNVSVSFSLHKILKFDELHGTIQFRGNMHVGWTDERLVWKPERFNGISNVYVTANTIWRPEIVLANPSRHLRFFGGDTSRLLTNHTSDGRARMVIGDTFDCTCHVDLTSFPWDTQKCNLEATVWGYQLSEVKLVSKLKYVEVTEFRTDGEWELLGTNASSAPNTITSVVVFEHFLRRRSVFFFVNIILPIVTLSALTSFVFFIPIDSGERISFSLTLLLSTAVFMTLISESLPPNAETMSTVCYLLLCVMVHNTLTCVLNIASLNIFFKNNDESEPGKIWKRLFKLYTMNSKAATKVNPADNSTNSCDYEEGDCDTKSHDIDETEKTAKRQNTVTWKDISGMLDSFFFCIMTLLLLGSYAMFSWLVLQ